MNKSEFLENLKKALSGLLEEEVDERLSFYGEMIDDAIEEGSAEEDAVAAIGSVEELSSQILADTPFTEIAKERLKPKSTLSWWAIVLIILSSPIWASLLISLFAVMFSVYISLWSVVISLWAVFVSLLVSALGCLMAGTLFMFLGKGLSGAACIGAAFVCAGFGIFIFFVCKAATKGTAFLLKVMVNALKKCFIKKKVLK